MEKKPSLNVFLLTLINIATILSIENWAFLAEYKFSSLFFLLLTAVAFFIPVSLVSAELASAWPERGGIFIWVKQAFGERLGFFSVLLLWISNLVWFPTILSYFAVTFSYAFAAWDLHPLWLHFLSIGLISSSVVLSHKFGIRFMGRLSSLALLFGTLVPGCLIILGGFYWVFSGQPLQMECSWRALLPNFSRMDELVFLTGVLITFSGIEINAIHARDVEQPHRNYPKAIFFSGLVIFLFSLLGTFSISIAVPRENIDLVSATMEALSHYLNFFGVGWLLPILALFIGIGGIGGMTVWIAGSNQGLLTALQQGDFGFKSFANARKDYSFRLMGVQAFLALALSMIGFFMPDMNGFYWILTALSSQLYLFMYILMFGAAIVLRLNKPDVERPYKIPGGTRSMILVAGAGLTSSLFGFGISFFPPGQIETGNLFVYESFFLVIWGALIWAGFFYRRKRTPAPTN
ncbi:MAG: amino acid permease [Verrucomicrobia bacterium]|nr:amino acid permease [Verrucomicrobiota bacterium]